jgi:hypothetical protein
MKLNPDLVRELLLWGENNLPSESGNLEFPIIAGFDEQEIAYHCLMSDEAGFFESINISTNDDLFQRMHPRRLTYSGHQYLETIRDEKVWAKAKEGARKIGSFSMETLGMVAKAVIAVQVKKYTGLEID